MITLARILAMQDHERVDDSLEQGHRDHVAVGDVRDLVGDHGFDLVGGHRLEQPEADRDECVVPLRPGGEGVR